MSTKRRKLIKFRRVIVKEELLAITNDFKQAIVLDRLLYWLDRVLDFDDFIREETLRQEYWKDNFPLTHGWIYKTAAELSTELLQMVSERTVNRTLDALVDKAFLLRRNNPHKGWDRTYQYRPNLPIIHNELRKIGASLNNFGFVFGDKIEFPDSQEVIYEWQPDNDNIDVDTPSDKLSNASDNGTVIPNSGNLGNAEKEPISEGELRQNVARSRQSDGAIPIGISNLNQNTAQLSSAREENSSSLKEKKTPKPRPKRTIRSKPKAGFMTSEQAEFELAVQLTIPQFLDNSTLPAWVIDRVVKPLMKSGYTPEQIAVWFSPSDAYADLCNYFGKERVDAVPNKWWYYRMHWGYLINGNPPIPPNLIDHADQAYEDKKEVSWSYEELRRYHTEGIRPGSEEAKQVQKLEKEKAARQESETWQDKQIIEVLMEQGKSRQEAIEWLQNNADF